MMSTESRVLPKSEQGEIISSLNRAQAILRLIADALHKGVELVEPEGLFESVERELNQVCGLVTGDLFLSKHGEIILNLNGRESERPAEEAQP